MEITDIIGTLAGLFTTVAVVPQIIKAVRTREVDDISPVFFSTLILGVGLWTCYGFLKNDLPIIITNGISVLLNGTMLWIFFRAKKKQEKSNSSPHV